MWQQQIRLTHGVAQAVVDTYGAWLRELAVDGVSVLHPATILGSKPDGSPVIRGGSHVCMPNFGPDINSVLPQHGYGRAVPWDILERNESLVKLCSPRGSGLYQNLYATLEYQMTKNGIAITLECFNEGNIDVPLSPGLHPYFQVADTNEQLSIDDTVFALDTLIDAQIFVPRKERIQISQTLRAAMHVHGFSEYVLWTDNPSTYVCIEPTDAGFAFSKKNPPLLKAGQKKMWHAIISSF